MQTRTTIKTILRVDALPTLPDVISRIMSITGDPMSSMKELAVVIEQDLALSANMLRLVNSAYFGFSRKIGAIQDAGVLLGYESIRAMALGTSVVTSMNIDGFDCRRFWAHSLATAMATSRLASELEHPDAESAFMAGLLHDVGILLLAVSFPEQAGKVYLAEDDAHACSRSREREVFGISHDQAGGHVARSWKFEPVLTRGIEEHHFQPDDIDQRSAMGRMIMLAEWGLGERHRLHFEIPLTDDQAAEVARSLGYPIEMVSEALSGLERQLGMIEPLLSMNGAAA